MRFKLGDFGLGINSNEELPFTRSGTLDYMAPEVINLYTISMRIVTFAEQLLQTRKVPVTRQ